MINKLRWPGGRINTTKDRKLSIPSRPTNGTHTRGLTKDKKDDSPVLLVRQQAVGSYS